MVQFCRYGEPTWNCAKEAGLLDRADRMVSSILRALNKMRVPKSCGLQVLEQ